MENKTINKTLKVIELKLKNENFEITIEELQKLGIETINNSIKIGKNVLLVKKWLLTGYEITFIDKKKDLYDKLLDSYVDIDEVFNVLINYKLTKSKYNKFNACRQSEVEWNKDLEKYFSNFFINVKRGNPNKSIEIDLDIGKGEIGIELKWADKINSKNNMSKTYGQIGVYSEDSNYKSLILVVAGTSKYEHNSFILDIAERIKKSYNCDYYYMKIQ